MNRVLFRGARLLDPASGLDGVDDLLVEGERIAAIGDVAAIAHDGETVDAAGLSQAASVRRHVPFRIEVSRAR